MSVAMLWPSGKCVECANKSDCVDSQAQIIDCMSNGYPDYKPMTNADCIRAMSDEELDKFLGDVQWDVANYCGGVTQKQAYPVPEQRGAWLDWLKQEVENV